MKSPVLRYSTCMRVCDSVLMVFELLMTSILFYSSMNLRAYLTRVDLVSPAAGITAPRLDSFRSTRHQSNYLLIVIRLS
jgi:hypothetical protein